MVVLMKIIILVIINSDEYILSLAVAQTLS